MENAVPCQMLAMTTLTMGKETSQATGSFRMPMLCRIMLREPSRLKKATIQKETTTSGMIQPIRVIRPTVLRTN